MGDYYSILARAVLGLSDNTARSRHDLYHRARALIIEQLRDRRVHLSAVEAIREQAALEAAMGRVEAEARSGEVQTASRMAFEQSPIASTSFPGGPGVEERSELAAKVSIPTSETSWPSNDIRGGGLHNIEHPMMTHTDVELLSAEPGELEPHDNWHRSAAVDSNDVRNSLSTMLLAVGYGVTAIAFTGVVYYRGAALVSTGAISYPMFIATVALMLCLFILPPLTYLLRERGTSIPSG